MDQFDNICSRFRMKLMAKKNITNVKRILADHERRIKKLEDRLKELRELLAVK